mgnify:CR=1 FL=1
MCIVFCQAEDGIRYLVRSRGLGDVYKRQRLSPANGQKTGNAPEAIRQFSSDAGKRRKTLLKQGVENGTEHSVTNRICSGERFGSISVSYTHLTLPTSDLV